MDNENTNKDLEIQVTCAMCTTGCEMTAKYVDGKPYVSGSRCPRGDKYGAQKLMKAAEQ